MFNLYGGLTWQRTVMPGVIRSSKWLTSFKKAIEMHIGTGRVKGKLELPQTPHRTLSHPVETAHGPAFSALDSSVMSVPEDDVNRLPNLRSRSQAIIITNIIINIMEQILLLP